MATIPGTKFTEREPPVTGQSLLPALSTGMEHKVVGGVEKLGRSIESYALNTKKQEMLLEYSERERQIDEAGWAARNAVTGDEEADRKLWEKFQQDAQVIASSSKYVDVNNDLSQYINKVSPNWERGLYVESLRKQRNNHKDAFFVEWETGLENGNIRYDLLDKSLALGIITQEKHDYLSRTAVADSHLKIAERLLSLGNYDASIAELEKIDPESMTNLQLRERNQILAEKKRLTGQAKADKAQEAILKQRESINTFVQKLLDPREKGWIQDVEYDELEKHLSEAKAEKWSEIYDHQADEPAKKTNFGEFAKLEKRVFDFWTGEANSDISDLQTELAYAYKAENKHLTEHHYKELLSRLNTKLPDETIENYRAVFDKAGRMISNSSDRANFNIGLFHYVKNNPNTTYDKMEELLSATKERMAVSYVDSVMSKMEWPKVGYGRWYPLPSNPVTTKKPKKTKEEIDITSPPAQELEAYWDKVSSDDKKKIWQYYHAGYSVADIIEALE